LNSQLNCILSLLIGLILDINLIKKFFLSFVACSLGLLFLYGFIAKGDTLLLIYFVFCLIVGFVYEIFIKKYSFLGLLLVLAR